jgi:D-alanyl-lipoteichoic acid acyltransferase DltB (MBOAT superfamily)
VGFTQPIFLVFLLGFSLGLLALEWRARRAREAGSAGDGRVRTRYVAYASLVFYGLWYPPGVVLLLLHAVLLRWASPAIARGDRRVQALAIGLCLGTLGLFKYADFFLDLIWADAPTLGLFLPLGISFYTFTVVGYYVDLGRGDAEPASDFAEGLLLIAFWPHLAAGPILRARDVIRRGARRAAMSSEVWALGLTLIAAGLVRKLLIADNIGAYVNHNIEQGVWGMGTLEAWAVVLGFGAQIYADFSGYSDMAIGFALLLGYRLPANFNFPYRATSMREFWRRWHISLSSWFRDYLYIPLGGGEAGEGGWPSS